MIGAIVASNEATTWGGIAYTPIVKNIFMFGWRFNINQINFWFTTWVGWSTVLDVKEIGRTTNGEISKFMPPRNNLGVNESYWTCY